MHEAIGGFFELEGCCPHEPIENWMSSGRSGLRLILRSIKCDKIYIPIYCCPVVTEVIIEEKIPFHYYHVNKDLEINSIPLLQENEFLLYVNYFGIKDSYCRYLEETQRNLILDLTQAFFFRPQIDTLSFSSARKFFGIPDGGIVTGVTSAHVKGCGQLHYNDTRYLSHLLFRADGNIDAGYKAFHENNDLFKNVEPLQGSILSQNLFGNLCVDKLLVQRNNNYQQLRDALSNINILKLDDSNAGPLCYPLLIKDGLKKKKELIANKVFIPTYWPGIEQLSQINDTEENFRTHLLALPCDHRYNFSDVNIIKEAIL